MRQCGSGGNGREWIWIAIVASGVAAGCSDSSSSGGASCGPGTELVDGACVPAGGGSDIPLADGFGSGDGTAGEEGGGKPGDDTAETPDGTGSDSAGDAQDAAESDGGTDTTSEPDALAVCTEGDKACKDDKTVQVCISGQWQLQVCPGTLTCTNGFCTQLADCEPGEVDGCFDSKNQRLCDESGTAWVPNKCEGELWCYEGVCSEQQCGEGDKKCIDANIVGVCSEDLTEYVPFKDCGPSAVCVGDKCLSGCDALVKYNKSYIGCEYWTVDLDQYDDPFGVEKESDYAIVISNPGLEQVTLQFLLADGSTVDVVDPTVAPGHSRAFVMPTLNVDGSGVTQKSVRVLSDFPVVAYQFNPLYGGGGGLFSGIASNDASLLIPIHAIGKDYWITSWPTAPLIDIIGAGIQPQHSYFTVVAVEAGTTTVYVESSAFTNGGPGVSPMAPGQKQEIQLQRFDVLNIEADKGMLTFNLNEIDVTGTHVYANKNIIVFAGHEEAVISDDGDASCCAEHLEEQLWPVPSWRKEFVCVKTSPRSSSNIEPDLWRVLAVQNGTQLTTVPPVSGIHGKTLNKGQWLEVFTSASFVLTATNPLQVMQFTVARDRTEQFTGDPSMILTVPHEQYRDDYTILVPDGYTEDFLTVIRPPALPILMDGNLLPDGIFKVVPGAGWEYAYVKVLAGVHKLNATEPFGLVGYGWSNAVSYGYPAGTNLIGD